jgi:hypothetical protein
MVFLYSGSGLFASVGGAKGKACSALETGELLEGLKRPRAHHIAAAVNGENRAAPDQPVMKQRRKEGETCSLLCSL